MCVPWRSEESVKYSRTEVPGCCKTPNMGTRNQTCVLLKNNKLSWPLSHLASPNMNHFLVGLVTITTDDQFNGQVWKKLWSQTHPSNGQLTMSSPAAESHHSAFWVPVKPSQPGRVFSNWWDVLKPETGSDGLCQHKNPSSSPGWRLTSSCMLRYVKNWRKGATRVSIVGNWPLSSIDLHSSERLNSPLQEKTLP